MFTHLRRLTAASAVAAAIGLAPLVASGETVSPPPLAFQAHQLDNGLRVVLAEDHARPVINVQIWYHVGSKDERKGRTGFAHLFEHMMFRGSRNVGPEEHMRFIREAGGAVNAYTSFDQTVYWQTVPSHVLERVLWLEADRMESLVINEENFTKEREVVKEERRLRYENPPYGLTFEDLLNATFQIYPYKHPPIGSMEDLNAATVADVQEFFDTFYVPNNATLVIVGDFEAPKALELVRKYFGRIERGRDVPRVSSVEPPQTEARTIERSYANVPLPAVVSAWRLPPAGHPDTYPLQIAVNILSSGESSRLYRKLVYEEQISPAAWGQVLLLEGPSLFFGFAAANPGKDIKAVRESFEQVIDGMRKAPVTPEELEKARNGMIAEFILGRQTVQQRADDLGRATVLLGDPELYNKELARYQAVTAEDVQRVCAKYLDPKAETRLWITPGTK